MEHLSSSGINLDLIPTQPHQTIQASFLSLLVFWSKNPMGVPLVQSQHLGLERDDLGRLW